MGENGRDLTAANRQLVLGCLLDFRTKSRIDIAKMTGLAPASVNRLTKVLLDSGLVTEAGQDTSTGGRPSMLLRFNPRARQMLAIDVSDATLEAATVALDGEVLDHESINWSGQGSERRVSILLNYVRDRVAEDGDESFVAVGVSIPGPVTEDGVVMVAPSLGWSELPLGSMLQDVVSVPVIVENDMNLYAYAEWSRNPSTDDETLVALGVYHGIGLGIVEGGRVWRGKNGAGGQMGRMYLDLEGFTGKQNFGFGQTEEHLGTSALRRSAIERGLLPKDATNVDPVFAAVENGSVAAREFLEEVMLGYAFQIANFSAVMAPDTIVLCGLFERWSSVVAPMLSERLEGTVLQVPQLTASALKEDAKLIGAGLYSLDQLGGITALA